MIKHIFPYNSLVSLTHLSRPPGGIAVTRGFGYFVGSLHSQSLIVISRKLQVQLSSN